MALERELQRLRDKTKQFDELHEGVKKAVLSWPFLVQLERCVQRIRQQYSASIETRLAFLAEGSRISPSVAAKPTHSLERGIDRLLALLGSLVQGLDAIPNELIEFISWCFSQTRRPDSPFAIAIDDKVAMLTLKEVSEANDFETLFPEFIPVFGGDSVGQFVVLFVPAQFLKRSRSLNWSVVGHEIGHAYLERSGLVSRMLPDMPASWAALRVLAEKGSASQKATAKRLMRLTEYACDEVAVRLTGCAFAWRLLTDFFSLEQVSSSTTHPQIDRRVRRAAQLARASGFGRQADLVLQQLKAEISEMDRRPESDDVPADDLDSLSLAIKRDIRAVEAAGVEEACKRHAPRLTAASAAAALHDGQPVALDPWAVLCLSTPDQAIHSSEALQEVIADSIRLGQMAARFQEIMKK